MHISLFALSFCLIIEKMEQKKKNGFRPRVLFVSSFPDNVELNAAEPNYSITLS